MNDLTYDANTDKKRAVKKAIVIFVAVMLLLTFFSSTINNFSLPKVAYENPSGGALIKEITGSGSVQSKATYDMYLDTPMKVTDTTATAGDKVLEGQTIMTLDTGDLEKQLQDQKDQYAQKQLSLEKLKQTGERLKQAGAKLQLTAGKLAETGKELENATSEENMLNLDKAVQVAQQNLAKAQKNYDMDKDLYDIGAISQSELTDAKSALDNAAYDYKAAVSNKDKATTDNANAIESNKRDIAGNASDIASNASDIESNRLDMESANIDLAAIQRKIDDLTSEINKAATVTSPCDGIITELNFTEGMTANTSQPLYKIADTGGGFKFAVTVDASAAEYLELGDPADITLNSSSGRVISGKVSKISDNQSNAGEKKDIEIDVPPDGLVGGEAGSINMKKNIGSFKTLVPNSALGQENGGYFVYVLMERRGPLGNELYIQKVSVTVGDSDNLKTAVLSGLTPMDRVITECDKALSDGSRVMLSE